MTTQPKTLRPESTPEAIPVLQTESSKPKKRGRTWLLPVLILGSLGITVLALLRPSGVPAQTVNVVAVQRGLFEKSVSGTGSAKAEVSRTVSFTDSGKVQEIAVRVGDRVVAGQRLARLDTAVQERDLAAADAAVVAAQADLTRARASQQESGLELSRGVQSAQIALQSAQAALSEAERVLGTQRQLKAIGGVSANEVAVAQRNRDEAARKVQAAQTDLTFARQRTGQAGRAAVAQAQASLEAAVVRQQNVQRAIAQAELRAPTSGVISAVNVTAGNAATAGQTAFEITDASRLYLEVPFDETRATGLAVGQPASVQFDALPNQALQGTVDRIDPVARSSGQVANVLVRIRLRDASAVKPGFTATAKVTTRRLKDAALIPLEVSGEEKGKTQVWTVVPGETLKGKTTGTMQAKPITITDRNTNQAAVQGLQKGDLLVSPYPSEAKAGQTVVYSLQSEQGASEQSDAGQH